MAYGRHGWPRKNELMRLYRERGGAYILIDVEPWEGYYSAIANVLVGKTPSLGSCNVPIEYTYKSGCSRVQWSELPPEWQEAFLYWLRDTPPESVPGFWLKGNMPGPSKNSLTRRKQWR